ncbi:hypothetical protein P389DRAFT_192567 [Cystobasidium minutum MCA 4210]|uniref:uncharacterized protein n=1 Tax=Cystobasidium minutum MCA 4210 TaxID=1397322 RepID=UPI0034CD785F|eukprot:jgi/Rhomi1/192567/gm1.781_g
MSQLSYHSGKRVAAQPHLQKTPTVNTWLERLPSKETDYQSLVPAKKEVGLSRLERLCVSEQISNKHLKTTQFVKISPAWAPTSFRITEYGWIALECFIRNEAGGRAEQAAACLMMFFQTIDPKPEKGQIGKVETDPASFRHLLPESPEDRFQQEPFQKCFNVETCDFYVPAEVDPIKGIWLPAFIVAVKKNQNPAFKVLSDGYKAEHYKFSNKRTAPFTLPQYTLPQGRSDLGSQRIPSRAGSIGSLGHEKPRIPKPQQQPVSAHKRTLSELSATAGLSNPPSRPKLRHNSQLSSAQALHARSGSNAAGSVSAGQRRNSTSGNLVTSRVGTAQKQKSPSEAGSVRSRQSLASRASHIARK